MLTFAFQDVILVFIGRKKAKSWGIITRYLKKQKSLIQHYERSELRFHFEWTKVYQKCQKWSILAWDLRSISATRQVNINRTKIGGKCQNICFFTWKVSWQFRHLLQSVGVAKCVVWVENEKSRQFLLKIPPKRKRYFSK